MLFVGELGHAELKHELVFIQKAEVRGVAVFTGAVFETQKSIVRNILSISLVIPRYIPN